MDILKEAGKSKIAVGHFNFSDLVVLRAVFEAASGLRVPVMVGTSEGEREFVGVRQAVALVKSLRDEHDFPIYINADHTHSLDKVEEAAGAGYDEILFDGSKLTFKENVRQTKHAVELAKSINPENLVEGEIGYIGASSEIIEKRPKESLKLTTPEEAKQFVEETGIDVLAPAVGNMHGLLEEMVAGKIRKRLNIQRIREIKSAVEIPLTLHGGSGTDEKDFVEAINAGINIIHINTEIRLAWRRGVEEGLKSNPKEIAPYKIFPPAFRAVRKITEERLKLFNRIS